MKYIKNADLYDYVWNVAFLSLGRLTDKAEKFVELYKPQMRSVDEKSTFTRRAFLLESSQSWQMQLMAVKR